jgi:uncharacterized protein YjiS (DUF1127 family)
MAQMLDIEAGIVPHSGGLWRSAGAYAHKPLDAVISLASYVRECIATWAKRRRDRLELLNYLAQDHRAAGDMGTSRADAEHWARQPFWRP